MKKLSQLGRLSVSNSSVKKSGASAEVSSVGWGSFDTGWLVGGAGGLVGIGTVGLVVDNAGVLVGGGKLVSDG